MPALTAYTPYETLVFFQNVAELGADQSTLQEISSTLNANHLIRESASYDASKLAPDALQSLYDQIVSQNKSVAASKVNGEALPNGDNPVKKEITHSSNSYADHEQFIQDFADRLYAQFKEQTIRELRQQEKEYGDLQTEIAKLSTSAKDEQAEKTDVKEPIQQPHSSPVAADPAGVQLQTELTGAKSDAKSVQSQTHSNAAQHVSSSLEHRQPTPIPLQRAVTPRSASGTPVPRPVQPSPVPQSSQHPSPITRTLPPPSPQRGSYGPLPPPHAYAYHTQNQPQPHMLPPIQNLQRIPSSEGYSRPSSQGRGSPMPHYSPSPYPHYPPYQQPPHGWHGNVHQYPQQGYPPQQHPPPQNMYTQVQTPHQPTYPGYPNTAPVPYPAQQQWRPPQNAPYHQYPASASVTPVHKSVIQNTFIRSGSSTPWKNRSTPLGFRPQSPTRLDREVSPLSDSETPPPESPRRQSRPLKKALPHAVSTPDVTQSRSQSVFSNASDVPEPPKRKVGRPPKIKAEQPTTPAPLVSDAEQTQRSSGRRGRPRASITSTTVPDQSKPTPALKRKREAASSSPAPRNHSGSGLQIPSTVDRLSVAQSDNNYVVVSRTFGKTSQLLLNEITSHKLAGIFAKPLSERDAPGYKSLIHRPQDLKTIKAAISKGSKAAIAAIDELEPTATLNATESGDSSTIAQDATPESSSIAGPIGNGFYLVRATEDLLPPKGIVNSSQLEAELVRMFANAVMFNPLPTSERGFGRSLRLHKRGGTLLPHGTRRGEPDPDVEASQAKRDASESITVATSSSESLTSESVLDDGGIISDTREMFEDVEKLVSGWKDLEGDKISGPANAHQQGSFTERHASVSASSAAGDDMGDVEGTPVASGTGSMRKRRRVGDH